VAYGQQLERSSLKLGANNNVVDFEGASVDVAQHQVGRASRVDRGDARDCQSMALVVWRTGAWKLEIVKRSDAVGFEVALLPTLRT
jgi:hypothetical protein